MHIKTAFAAALILVASPALADGPGVVTQIVTGGPALPACIQFQTGGPSWYGTSINNPAANFNYGQLGWSLAIGRTLSFNTGGLSQDYADCSAPSVVINIVSRFDLK